MISPASSWKMIGLALTAGVVAGFSIPLATSYQPSKGGVARGAEVPGVQVRLVGVPAAVAVVASTAHDAERDAEMEALAARNRRLVALIATLRKRN